MSRCSYIDSSTYASSRVTTPPTGISVISSRFLKGQRPARSAAEQMYHDYLLRGQDIFEYSEQQTAELPETNNILAEEQNGFRAGRSCIDHLFVMCTVLRNRKALGKETFLCFIDYQKAFDSVDRNLLLFKLHNIGVTGFMYKAISSLYSNPRSRIILQDYNTDYFDCPIGVKQGDCLSPTLFSIFINDLSFEIKNSNIGINIDIEDIAGNIDIAVLNILLYADDIVLFAENEEDLQSLLYIVQVWCEKWRLQINLAKTNILHVRTKRKMQSKYVFVFNKHPVTYCKFYKYLGCYINEHIDYDYTAKMQSDSAGRPLG